MEKTFENKSSHTGQANHIRAPMEKYTKRGLKYLTNANSALSRCPYPIYVYTRAHRRVYVGYTYIYVCTLHAKANRIFVKVHFTPVLKNHCANRMLLPLLLFILVLFFPFDVFPQKFFLLFIRYSFDWWKKKLFQNELINHKSHEKITICIIDIGKQRNIVHWFFHFQFRTIIQIYPCRGIV